MSDWQKHGEVALAFAQDVALEDGHVWDELGEWQRDLYVKSSASAIRLMQRRGEWIA